MDKAVRLARRRRLPRFGRSRPVNCILFAFFSIFFFNFFLFLFLPHAHRRPPPPTARSTLLPSYRAAGQQRRPCVACEWGQCAAVWHWDKSACRGCTGSDGDRRTCPARRTWSAPTLRRGAGVPRVVWMCVYHSCACDCAVVAGRLCVDAEDDCVFRRYTSRAVTDAATGRHQRRRRVLALRQCVRGMV